MSKIRQLYDSILTVKDAIDPTPYAIGLINRTFEWGGDVFVITFYWSNGFVFSHALSDIEINTADGVLDSFIKEKAEHLYKMAEVGED